MKTHPLHTDPPKPLKPPHPTDYGVYYNCKTYRPLFKRGDWVKRRGENISGLVEGWTFYPLLPMFHYYITGYGTPIPEDQLYIYKPKKK